VVNLLFAVRRRTVGWPGGIAPPGSNRSRRDSLPSPGSSHQLSERADPLPLGEQVGFPLEEPGPPPLEPLVGIFGNPTYEMYRFVPIVPAGKRSAVVHWHLSCQDQDGNPAGDSRGQFSVARSATRDICNHRGAVGIVLTPCNPALSEKLGACAFSLRLNPDWAV